MSEASSLDLHPTTGARFVFERQEASEELQYRLCVYLPGGRFWEGELAWRSDVAEIRFQSQPSSEDAWSEQAALKLARVLHRNPKEKLVRWRDA